MRDGLVGVSTRPTLMVTAPGIADQRRELRLALVLNGGVSLAIWIGGVVAEIDRARRAGLSGGGDLLVGCYRDLLDVTGSVLRTDVISGASAGGLNGCLLAAAVANGSGVADLRDLWISIGSFRSLLRSGLDPAPKSVLRGDDYFLPEIQAQFARRCNPEAVAKALDEDDAARRRRALRERVRLFVTGTDIYGEQVDHLDDYGGVMRDYEHRALFVLEHNPGVGRSAFADPQIARQLARIARSTASFPGAFEASFCSVSEDGKETASGSADDPDLRRIASFTSSRWVIDGGVLDNAPFRPALAAMGRAPSAAPVRRILCYVTPYGTGETPPASVREAEPGLRAVLGAASSLPRDVTGSETLEDVESYRRRVASRRTGRSAIGSELAAYVVPMANDLLPLYCRHRTHASIDDVLDDIRGGTLGRFLRESARSTTRPRVRTEQLARRGVVLPWVPDPGRAHDADYAQTLLRYRAQDWAWGLEPVARSAAIVVDLLARVLEITPPPADEREEELHARVYKARLDLARIIVYAAQATDGFIANARATDRRGPLPSNEQLDALNDGHPLNLAGLDLDERSQLATLLRACAAYRERLKPEVVRGWMNVVIRELSRGGSAAEKLLTLPAHENLAPERRQSALAELRALLDGADGKRSRPAWFERLLRLEIVHEALAPSGGEYDQRLDLIRINAEAPCELDLRNEPQQKLTGLALAHFGAFYKRSWRANDWLWGRLDGASRLVDILVEPAPLRLRLAASESVASLTNELRAIAVPDGADGNYLNGRFQQTYSQTIEQAIGDELTTLQEWALEGEPTTRLERTRHALRARLQLAIAREELPIVRQCALEDAGNEGGAIDAAGAAWARGFASFDAPEDVVSALTALRIAKEETFAGEVGADLLTRNIATTAVVAASALSAPGSGIPRIARIAPRALRGLLIALYALTWGLTSPKRALKTIAFVALLLALMILAWALLADVQAREAAQTTTIQHTAKGPPGWLEALAKLIVAGGLLLGILRAGLVGLGLALAFAAAYLTLVLTPWPEGYDLLERLFKTSTLASVTLALLLAGLLAGLIARPLHYLKRALRWLGQLVRRG